MPPRRFATITIPEELYKDIKTFFTEERDFFKKGGVRSLPAWITISLYNAMNLHNLEKKLRMSTTSKNSKDGGGKGRKDPTILIVDDDENISRALKVLFEPLGYSVDVADTGEEAIRMSHERPYNVAFVDIRLPDMNGTELLTKLAYTTPRTLKIIITGYASLDNASAALNMGADAYVTKPFKPEELVLTVRKKLEEQTENLRINQNRISEFIKDRLNALELH